MQYRKVALKIIFGLLIFPLMTAAFADPKIVICTDTNFWYPFTYVKNNQASGLHIDIISAALRNLNIEPIYKPATWKECLDNAKSGVVDAIATASYRDDRAFYLNYPEGAATDKKSPWRVTQVSYRVITPAFDKDGEKNAYYFNGDIKKIPQPIRLPKNYSLVNDLRKEGLEVKEGLSSIDNFKDLVKEQTGSVVDLPEVAQHLGTQPEFSDKLRIQITPLGQKSYFLAFSQSGKYSLREAEQIWAEIAKIRENQILMAEFLKKY
jgi:polar amino acid transport system substrate-binding protein